MKCQVLHRICTNAKFNIDIGLSGIYVCFNIEDRLSLKTLLKVCLSKWPPVKLPPRVSFLTRGIHMNQMLNALICRNLSIFQIAISGVIGSPTA